MAKKSGSNAKFEIAFFEKVLLNAPDFVEALACLGDLYTRQGAYEKGLRVDERLARLRPDDAVVLYNLACSYSLVADIPAARRAMARAVECGYDEWDHLRQDPDLLNLLADPKFQQFLNEKRLKDKCGLGACGSDSE